MLRLLTSENCVYVRVCFEGERDLMAFKFLNFCLISCRLVCFYFLFFFGFLNGFCSFGYTTTFHNFYTAPHFGFRRNRSTITQLLTFLQKVYNGIENQKEIDVKFTE